MKIICVEIDGVFYDTIKLAQEKLHHNWGTIKKKCLSDDYPNYKIVPFQITYTEKLCRMCGKIKPLNEFATQTGTRDGKKTYCKQCGSEYNNGWREKNQKRIKERNKEYRKTHKQERNAQLKERRKIDTAFNINASMSTAIRESLKDGKNGDHWEALVDYDLEELMAHLKSKFTDGMNWDNYGWGKDKWNIDHVIAKCHFNITSRYCQDFKDCWALDNLQPLWQIRNFEKGNRLMEDKYLIKL